MAKRVQRYKESLKYQQDFLRNLRDHYKFSECITKGSSYSAFQVFGTHLSIPNVHYINCIRRLCIVMNKFKTPHDMTTAIKMLSICQKRLRNIRFWEELQLVLYTFSIFLPSLSCCCPKLIICIKNSLKENALSFLCPPYLSHGNSL